MKRAGILHGVGQMRLVEVYGRIRTGRSSILAAAAAALGMSERTIRPVRQRTAAFDDLGLQISRSRPAYPGPCRRSGGHDHGLYFSY